MKYFITSDVHGYYYILKEELEKKGWEDENPDHKLIILGDVFDRGDETIKLYKWLKSLDDRFIYIKGNHEQLAIRLYEDLHKYEAKDISDHHYHNGTLQTLDAFSPFLLEAFFGYPQPSNWDNKALKDFIEWLKTKPVNYYELGDNIFVHGWIPMKKYSIATDDEWKDAQWHNGMLRWSEGLKIKNKTIWCGHWYTTWGHSYLHNDFKTKDEPFKDEGIVALDATTCLSGKVNIEIIEA